MNGTCIVCGCEIHKEGESWVDNSGGDICEEDNPHFDTLETLDIRTDEVCEDLATKVVNDMDYDALLASAIAHIRDWYLSDDIDAWIEFARERYRLMEKKDG